MTNKEAKAIIYNEILEATGSLACLEIEDVEAANCLSRLIEALTMALEAIQERPKGRWIADRYCSNCGYDSTCLTTAFCPVCGADMRESE